MHKKIARKILLNPGPATTTDTVKMAQVVSDICPREGEFSKLMADIREDLLKIVNVDKKQYETVLFGGSGTAVMESVISSVVSKEKTLLILINGAYGDRMCKIAQIHNVNHKTIKYKWGHPINFDEVELVLESDADIGYIAMVHHETTTGILNSINDFSTLGKKYNQTLILDAISSYAGIPIDINQTHLDFVMSTSNKCIQGMAGIAFVICNKEKLDSCKDIPSKSLYLDLYDQYQYMKKSGQMRFTPPVQTFYALKQAIDEYIEEGIINRYNRYKENWQILTNGLRKLGFNLLLDSENESGILTTIFEPNNPNFDFNLFHDILYDKGYTIYPGKITELKTFRIAIMGDLKQNDINAFLIELEKVLKDLDLLPLL